MASVWISSLDAKHMVEDLKDALPHLARGNGRITAANNLIKVLGTMLKFLETRGGDGMDLDHGRVQDYVEIMEELDNDQTD
jgi:hypothetical protein